VRFGELKLFGELVGLLGVFVGLAGEACDDVGADSNAWNESFEFCDVLVLPYAVVESCHPP